MCALNLKTLILAPLTLQTTGIILCTIISCLYQLNENTPEWFNTAGLDGSEIIKNTNKNFMYKHSLSFYFYLIYTSSKIKFVYDKNTE